MADAKKCDRCENFYEGNHIQTVVIFKNPMQNGYGYSGDLMDLCPDCQAALEKWIARENDKVKHWGLTTKEFKK